MVSVLDLIVPGAGTIAHALSKILALCIKMKEAQGPCTRLHTRLKDICAELQKMEEQELLPPSGAVDKYVAVVRAYYRYLQLHNQKSLVKRLARHSKMADDLLQIQEDVVALFQMLNLATAATLMDWKQQWEFEQQAQTRALAEMAKNDVIVLRELQDTRAQVAAVFELQFELQKRTDQQSDETSRLLKLVMATIVRASKVTIGKLPPWLWQPDEIQYEPVPFARGSFGSIHRGVWGAGTKVVVKCLLIDDAQIDERALKRIESEINIWHRLNHPNVIKMFGASHVSSPPFMVCEDATNGNLCSFLERSESNKQMMWRLLYQAALGLDYVHRNRVVHGDLKLNNILVGADGLAKLADFGLSAVRTCSTLSKEKADAPKMSGGLRWRAPECLRRRPTFASDVYSFAMCMIEAVIGEPPFGFLDDDQVRAALKDGEIPGQPDEMDDEVWKVVVSMTATNPKERLSLPEVLEKLKTLADAEEEAEHDVQPTQCGECFFAIPTGCAFCAHCGASTADETVESETEASASADASAFVCRVCSSALQSGNAFCAHCGARVKDVVTEEPCEEFATRIDSISSVVVMEEPRREPATQIDSTSSVTSLLSSITTGEPEEKKRALSCLGRKCIDKQERKAMYQADGIRVLLEVARSDAAYSTLLHALKCLSWGPDEGGGLSWVEFDDLVKHIRAPTPAELASVKIYLAHGDEMEKEEAVVMSACIAGRGDNDTLRNLGVLPLLVQVLQNGTDTQKQWAAFALGNFAATIEENRVAVAKEGGIAPLVALTRFGTDEQMRWGAYALGYIACNAENRVAIAKEGGISPLVALTRSGTDEQKRWAANALGNIAYNRDENQFEIVNESDIAMLVALTRSGTDEQKKNATYALGSIACNDDENCVSIAKAGGIAPLVALTRSGTEEQKRWAADALGNIAIRDRVVASEYKAAGAIGAIRDLESSGSPEARNAATRALQKIRILRVELSFMRTAVE